MGPPSRAASGRSGSSASSALSGSSASSAWGTWREICSSCGRSWAPADLRWLCTCGGLLDLVGPLADPFGPGADPVGAPEAASPLVRYAAALPPGAGRVDLGLSVTPVAEVRPGVYVKADYEHPTGSFKDRGASVMLGGAADLGVHSVVVDSSGNAGKSAAAHAAAAGIDCTVYLPAGTAANKVAGISHYGATVVEVPGDRAAAATAAQEAVRASGRWYASHVHQPLFHHGVKTLAYELFEQIPDLSSATVIVPAGNGTLVLGLWLGFGELVALGRLGHRPALTAVQADRCAPLAGLAPAAAGPGGGAGSDPGGGAPSAAAGIAIADPRRAPQVRGAVMASGGRVLAVSEDEIAAARSDLAGLGFHVEPTGAVAWAGLARMVEGGGAVGPLGPLIAVLTGR